jgi:vitamin B12 transporter
MSNHSFFPSFRATTLASAVAVAFPFSTWAQGTPTSAGDYVVTGARQAQAGDDVVRPVTVITAQEIRLSGQRGLIDLLQTFGGVEVTANGGLGQTSGVFIRGANSDHTVVLIDGVRVGSATLGTAALEAIPLNLIDRIEVLPGPSSSLYGSDAIGGVIQVFTKSVERSPGISLAATAGSWGLASLNGSYAQRFGDTEVSAALGGLRTSGYDTTTPSYFNHEDDRDGYRNTQASLRLKHQLNADHEVGVQWLQSRGRTEYDGGLPSGSYANQTVQTAAAHWRGKLSSQWLSELRVGRSWDKAQYVDSFPGSFNTRQDQLSWQNTFTVDTNTWLAGVEMLRQAVNSDTAYDVTSRRIRSVFGGWRGRWGAHALQADLRHDDNSQFGARTTGGLGWGWRVTQPLRLRAAFGTAFHAPTFNELYYPGFGNPALRPESSRSAEVGADLTLGAGTFSATWFDNRISSLIVYPPPFYTPTNVARARIQGLTLAAQSVLGSGSTATRLKANLTLQDPKSRDTGDLLQRRGRLYGGASINQSVGADTRVGAELAYAGARYDSANEAPGSRMGGYAVASLFAAHSFTPEWSLEGRVNNVTDHRYQLAQSFVTPRSNAQVTLRWTPAP